MIEFLQMVNIGVGQFFDLFHGNQLAVEFSGENGTLRTGS